MSFFHQNWLLVEDGKTDQPPKSLRMISQNFFEILVVTVNIIKFGLCKWIRPKNETKMHKMDYLRGWLIIRGGNKWKSAWKRSTVVYLVEANHS